MEEADTSWHEEDKRFLRNAIMLIVSLVALGILLGMYINMWAALVFMVFGVLFGYCSGGTNFLEESTSTMIIVGSVFTWLVALISWYFKTDQHIIGDLVREYILR